MSAGKTDRRRRRAGRSGTADAQGDARARRGRRDRAFRQGRQRQPFARHRGAASARRVTELPLLYPVTTELPTCSDGYRDAIRDFYDGAAAAIAAHLDAGRIVAVICEGDPLFYGSYMHLHTRLAPRFATEIVAGVTGMSGCWSAAGMPIAQGDDVFTVLPATLPEGELARRLADADAAVVMKVGRHLPKLRRALDTQRPPAARHLCRARHHGGREDDSARRQARRRGALFRRRAGAGLGRTAGRQAMSGRLAVVGLGPGDARYLTPEAEARARRRGGALRLRALSRSRAGARRPKPPRRPTIAKKRARAAAALRHAAQGAHVAVVSGGDPGVFAMAAAICEEIESGPESWRALDVAIIPGITAMLAVAARIGAPLGHDFCALSLSDNLKPWDLIERRLDAAAGAGFVIALYNPVSRARPWQFGNAIERLRRHLPPTTPVCSAAPSDGRTSTSASRRSTQPTRRRPTWQRWSLSARARPASIARPGRSPLVYTPRAAAEVSA